MWVLGGEWEIYCGFGCCLVLVLGWFFAVEWGVIGGVFRWFFRMSEVEWLYDFIPASVRFLVKNNPLAVKYNSMFRRLHFLKWYKINILSVKYFSLHLSVKLYYCTNTIIQFYLHLSIPSIYINISNIHYNAQKNQPFFPFKNFFKKIEKSTWHRVLDVI